MAGNSPHTTVNKGHLEPESTKSSHIENNYSEISPPEIHSVTNPMYHSCNGNNSSHLHPAANKTADKEKKKRKETDMAAAATKLMRGRIEEERKEGETEREKTRKKMLPGKSQARQGNEGEEEEERCESGNYGNGGRSENKMLWMGLAGLFFLLNAILVALIISLGLQLAESRVSSSSGVTSSIGMTSSSGVTSSPSDDLSKSEEASFCLPCSDVYLTSLEVTQNAQRMTQRMDSRNEALLCCAETHEDLTTLLGKMVGPLAAIVSS